MVIQHNMAAANANRMLGQVVTNQAKSTEKLSSGYRINRAADDAAGLSISEKMRGQIRGLDQASTNAQDGISLIQTAEGALNESHAILQRMRELSVQASTGTETDDDREAIQDEVSQLQEELDRIAETTEFNTMKLLDGSLSSVGASTDGSVTLGISDVFNATSATAENGVDLSTAAIAADFENDYVDKLTIDGTVIEVNWDDALDSTTKLAITDGVGGEDIGEELATKIQDVINKKIDESNATTGNKVAHVSVAYDSGKLAITSGTNGAASTISTTAGNDDSLFGKLGFDSTNATPVGTAVNGTYTIKNSIGTAATDKMTVSIGNQTYQMNLKDALTADTSTIDDAISSLVGDTTTGFTKVLKDYNDNMGLTSTADEVSIDQFTFTSEKGAIKITGPEGLAITFGNEKAAQDLGLSSAATGEGGKSAVSLQVGANEGQTIEFSINEMSAKALGVDGNKVNVSKQDSAKSATTIIDEAIKKVSKQRSSLGAVQNRLEHTIANLDTSAENLQTAESRIRDVDMAEEMVNFTKNNILQQAAQSMLAQANQSNQGVLSLLQ